MKPDQHTAEQIITILDQAMTSAQTVAAVCRDHGIAENTFYRWRKTYRGMAICSHLNAFRSRKSF